MTTYDYLTTTIGDEQVHKLACVGVISMKMVNYMEIYKYHRENGEKRHLTAKHFNMPISSVGYALQIMKQQI